ncbi:MAG: hypothetical protein EPO10_14550 [Reyranella sp.]|uniref:phage head spike fiber domain-containing protein n=1 Tax=Reyranella sp. TaxID=1929291 RepID=UPI00121AE2F9|nr:hypothetical protein [Reyranella sp.]TAJ97159.1 MAG: hypothetical protein EPO41_03975 [Reyranella sp.]TBR28136.1 MAG: hypothetical protein EPO10_14550 [Reyranella sp.]
MALTPRGLLVEAGRTELYTKNTDFSSGWGLVGCTINPNAVTGPDGTASADEVIEGTTTQQSLGQLAINFTSGVTYIHRIYAKAKTRNWIAVYWDPNRFGGTGFNYFDVANGVVGTASAGMTTLIRPAANGFYECIVIGTCTSTGAGNRSFWLANADGGRVYTGDGTSSLYIWGASLQVGADVTQHIATDAVTVATAADTALITNVASLTDQCWVVKARTPTKLPTGQANTVFQMDDGGNANRRMIYYLNGRLYVVSTIGGVAQATLDMGLVANGTDFSIAARFADANFAASLNGGTLVTETTAGRLNTLGMTTARIGAAAGGGFAWNSTIRYIETRRTASDAELPLLAA